MNRAGGPVYLGSSNFIKSSVFLSFFLSRPAVKPKVGAPV
jgi:hypothetical protein